MTRLYVFVEGQTEETFVRDVLMPYFLTHGIYLTAILAKTSPGFKGGIVNYDKIKYQIVRLCRQDGEAFVTTMIDYYGLPTDFPAYGEQTHLSARQRIKSLEQAFCRDIGEPNFIANLLLHEFEALLFCQPEKFTDWIDDNTPVESLLDIKKQFPTPEDINNNPHSAPSKRILAVIPTYRKTLHGPLIASDIGLDAIRAQCQHFDNWLREIAALNQR